MENNLNRKYQIAVEGLCVEYVGKQKTQKVLNNICFNVECNQFFSILGTNGSGKTTLLNSIAGLVQPDTGIAIIKSVENENISAAPMVALLHQDYRQTNFPWTSVMENVTYPLKFRGVK